MTQTSIPSEIDRSIRLAEISLQIQQRSIQLAQRRLEFSNELLKQGEVTARDVVESQTSLLDALDDYQQAQSTLQIQVLRFLQQTGTLRLDPDAGSIGQVLDRSAKKVGSSINDSTTQPAMGG